MAQKQKIKEKLKKTISSEATVQENVREGSPGGRSGTTGNRICETGRFLSR